MQFSALGYPSFFFNRRNNIQNSSLVLNVVYPPKSSIEGSLRAHKSNFQPNSPHNLPTAPETNTGSVFSLKCNGNLTTSQNITQVKLTISMYVADNVKKSFKFSS